MCERGVWVWLRGGEGCWRVQWGISGRRLAEVGERVRVGVVVQGGYRAVSGRSKHKRFVQRERFVLCLFTSPDCQTCQSSACARTRPASRLATSGTQTSSDTRPVLSALRLATDWSLWEVRLPRRSAVSLCPSRAPIPHRHRGQLHFATHSLRSLLLSLSPRPPTNRCKLRSHQLVRTTRLRTLEATTSLRRLRSHRCVCHRPRRATDGRTPL